MKRIFRIVTIFFMFSMMNIPFFATQEAHTTASSTATVEQSQKENDILTTISENARILVQQMQNDNRNVSEHKKALAALDKALNNKTFKELPQDVQSPIKNDTSIIKEESKAFFAMRKSLKKYNTKRAENALTHLAGIIKNQTEATTETVIAQAQNQVSTAIATTQDVTQEGQLIIEQTRQQLATGLISPVEAAKIIGEQNYKMGAAERALKKTTVQAKKDVEQSDAQSGYLSRLTTNIYNTGSRVIAPFKAGYGYSEEEKSIARAIIAELETQLKMTIDRYKIAYAQAKTPQERINLQQAFELTTRALHDEIYQQKIITGEAMSTQRKLFWGTVAVAGAVAAGYLGTQYFMPTQEAPVTPTELQAPVTIEQQAVVQPKDITPPASQPSMNEIVPTRPLAVTPSTESTETTEIVEDQKPEARADATPVIEPDITETGVKGETFSISQEEKDMLSSGIQSGIKKSKAAGSRIKKSALTTSKEPETPAKVRKRQEKRKKYKKKVLNKEHKLKQQYKKR